MRYLLCLFFIAACVVGCGQHESAPNEAAPPAPAPVTGTVGEASAAASPVAQPESGKVQEGYVPDEQAAITIAVAAWIPLYGKEQIESEKPFRAILKDGVWHVSGTLPEGWRGGTATAEISQQSGRVLKVYHGK